MTRISLWWLFLNGIPCNVKYIWMKYIWLPTCIWVETEGAPVLIRMFLFPLTSLSYCSSYYLSCSLLCCYYYWICGSLWFFNHVYKHLSAFLIYLRKAEVLNTIAYTRTCSSDIQINSTVGYPTVSMAFMQAKCNLITCITNANLQNYKNHQAYSTFFDFLEKMWLVYMRLSI